VGTDYSILSLVSEAGMVVKLVMLLLLSASILSWTYIFQRAMFFKHAQRSMQKFTQYFWSGNDMQVLYQQLSKKVNTQGLEALFVCGFEEFTRISQLPHATVEMVLDSVQRAMRAASQRELAKLEQHLSFLATVGSTSPYIGLFGTVWGIMTSFQALGGQQQVTIAMVAPGISEALVATAMGLLAAIPAVIAYNRYLNRIDRMADQYAMFAEEFHNELARQLLVTQK
jgi:biopolymer transport protein TolQ